MTPERYRKLPGRRRGFVKGASLWMASDHLLSVKSLRIREEYKRFHFRDIQAVTVARVPRFRFSTSDFLGVLLWLAAYFLATMLLPRERWILWIVAALMIIAWAFVAFMRGCRCRIYTAVSSEELPSLDRTWLARRFFDQLAPRIAEAQGAMPPGWAESAELLTPGPSSPLSPAQQQEQALHSTGKLHTFAADLFVATLWINAIANFLLLHSQSAIANWSQIVFGFALLAETVVLFIQHYRGALQRPMQRLAIANLIAVGVLYYVRQMMYSFSAAAKQPGADLRIPTFYAGDALTRGVDSAVCCILGLVGLWIIFLRKRP